MGEEPNAFSSSVGAGIQRKGEGANGFAFETAGETLVGATGDVPCRCSGILRVPMLRADGFATWAGAAG